MAERDTSQKLQSLINSLQNVYVDNVEKFQKYRKELEQAYSDILQKELQIKDAESERSSLEKSIQGFLTQEIELTKKGISRRTKLYQEVLKEKKVAEDSLEITKEKIKLLGDELDIAKEGLDQKKKNADLEKEAYVYATKRSESMKKMYDLTKKLLQETISISKYSIESDSAIKRTQLSMGMLTEDTNQFYKTIVNVSKETALIGVNTKDLAVMQGKYSEGLGRAVILGEKGLKSIALISKGTTLGADGAEELAIAMDNFGINAERSQDYVQGVLDKSHDMGVDASSSVKNITNALRIAQKYNFKEGVKGIEQMAVAASKYKLSMDSVAGMADKLFDIQGAIDMSAQLQVLGGEWSKMADPFKLMYQARNDMNGLYESVVKATAGVAQFNKATGTFDISALEQHRIRKVADQIGIPVEELVKSARELAKFNEIKMHIAPNVDPKYKDLITSMSTFGKDGKWTIDLGNGPKEVSTLTNGMLEAYSNQKATLEQNAKNVQALNEAWTNTITAFKASVMPVIKPILDILQKTIQGFGGWYSKLSEGGKAITAGVALLGPVIAKELLSSLIWYNNGRIMAAGFNSYMKTGGGFGGSTPVGGYGRATGGRTLMGGKFGKQMAVGMGVAGGLGAIMDIGAMFAPKGSNLQKGLSVGGGALSGGAMGAEIGSLFGPMGAIIGGALGGIGGGVLGAYQSGMLGGSDNSDVQQDYIMRPGQGAVPFSSKDTVIGFKPGGAIEQAVLSNNNGNVNYSNVNSNIGSSGYNNFTSQSQQNVRFNDINLNVNGKIELVSNSSNGITNSFDILSNPLVRREIAKAVQEELRKSLGGGKLNPNIA